MAAILFFLLLQPNRLHSQINEYGTNRSPQDDQTAIKFREVQVCLFNATGQQVYASVETLSKGGNQLRLGGLGDLPEGFYLLTLVSDGKSFSRKLVKSSR